VAAHTAAFNGAVQDGDWGRFAERFTEDARMSFPGLPVPDAVGRAAILEAYRSAPPDDTIEQTEIDPAHAPDVGPVDLVAVRWSRGGTGTMRITWRGDLVAALEVRFV